MKFVQIILISSWILNSNGQEENGNIDYSKLDLNKNELLGSRWAIEQTTIITVYHAFQIVDLVKVDVHDMSIRIDFHLKQRWEAVNLNFPKGLFKDSDPDDTFLSADENVLKSVWSPDSFIPNARETKILSIGATHSAVNIYKNKTIIYKARMYAVLGCSFTFQWYPLDMQFCDLTIESHRYASNVVKYEWEPVHPVTARKGILLNQYDLYMPPKLSKGKERRWAGKYEYPYVKMTFKFERKLGNNIIQIFTPTILVVILSYFSFWLALDAVPGRISLLVTCLLTLVTMHSGFKGVLPPVNYIKMMDIWMLGCMVFVFGAICEFVVVKYMKWRAQQIQTAKEEHEKYLKKNGIVFSPAAPTNFHIAGGKMFPLPNTIYPDMETGNHTENLRQKQICANSHTKQQAWQSEQMQNFKMPVEYSNIFVPRHELPQDYPGNINMPKMQHYNEPFHHPPPQLQRSIPNWLKIDRSFRILFPLLFAIFNGAYWPILLIGSAEQHSEQ